MTERTKPLSPFERGLQAATEGGLPFWKSSADLRESNLPDINFLEMGDRPGYWAGRVAGDLISDRTRGQYWRYNHPLAITYSAGREIGSRAGLEKPLHLALAGFGLANTLNFASGNTDLQNLDSGGRPRGYSAIYADPLDPTKSRMPILEVPTSYIVGGRHKLLPWDKFVQERPDVDPLQYERHKELIEFGRPEFFGLEKANPVLTAATGALIGGSSLLKDGSLGRAGRRAAIGGAIGAITPTVVNAASGLGLVRGAMDGSLEGDPYLRMFGYGVGAPALLATGAIAGTGYLAAKIAREMGEQYGDKEILRTPKKPVEQALAFDPLWEETTPERRTTSTSIIPQTDPRVSTVNLSDVIGSGEDDFPASAGDLWENAVPRKEGRNPNLTSLPDEVIEEQIRAREERRRKRN